MPAAAPASPAASPIAPDAVVMDAKSQLTHSLLRQSKEGLKKVDDHDEIRFIPGLPANFPEKLNEVPITPYRAQLSRMGGQRISKYLTPLSYEFCQGHDELRHIPRNEFSVEGLYIQNTGSREDQACVLCIIETSEYEKLKEIENRDSIGETMRRTLDEQLSASDSEKVTIRGPRPDVSANLVMTHTIQPGLSSAQAKAMVQK